MEKQQAKACCFCAGGGFVDKCICRKVARKRFLLSKTKK